MSYGCQQNLISSKDKDLSAVFEYLCGESNKVYNCALYYARQVYFKTRRIVNAAEICAELVKSKNRHFEAMYASCAQQTCIAVAEALMSYVSLIKLWSKGELQTKPFLPNYRKRGLCVVSYPKRWLKLTEQGVRVPLGKKVKAWFGLDAVYLDFPSNLDWEAIKEVRILPRNGAFYVEYVYLSQDCPSDTHPSNVLGIDHGIDNWLTCVSNVGTSFIIDGRHLKSFNQWYNKRLSQLKEGRPPNFWSKQLSRLTEKRNRQMRDAVNKAARLVINHCLQHQIGTIIFGWNPGQKQRSNLGQRINQQFVQIPTGRLKERIRQLCEQYGIRFIETEESYTSTASFLDNDELPKFGEKPDGWKPSGARVKRGLYRTATNRYINADAQAAANIIRKVSGTLGLSLKGLSSGVLTAPLRVRLWTA